MALPIGPFPFTLTNGTLADANQVMANFNTLLNGVNGLAPLSSAISGGTSNVAAGLATAGTTVTFTADSVTVATALNGSSYTLTSYSQSFNGATTGAGGMDTGSLPTSGFVAIYAIYNPTAPAISILGKNAAVSAPTIYNGSNMPAGYTASSLLGVWPTNATPALVAGYIKGKRFQFSVIANILSNSSTNRASLTSLSLASAVPVNAITCTGNLVLIASAAFAGGSPAVFLGSDGNGVVYQYNSFFPATTAAVNSTIYPDIEMPTPQTIFYQTALISASMELTLQVSSYTIP